MVWTNWILLALKQEQRNVKILNYRNYKEEMEKLHELKKQQMAENNVKRRRARRQYFDYVKDLQDAASSLSLYLQNMRILILITIVKIIWLKRFN